MVLLVFEHAESNSSTSTSRQYHFLMPATPKADHSILNKWTPMNALKQWEWHGTSKPRVTTRFHAQAFYGPHPLFSPDSCGRKQ
jgi:hypothetical protein